MTWADYVTAALALGLLVTFVAGARIARLVARSFARAA